MANFCGHNIQTGKNLALAKVKTTVFAIFSIQLDEEMVIEPTAIELLMTKQHTVGLPERVYILPWQTEVYDFDFMKLDHAQILADKIDEIVQQIDKNDPWVEQTFNVIGTGEGLVMYPVNLGQNGVLSRDLFTTYVWKAKGKSHAVVNEKTSVVLTPEIVASIDAYCDLMVTEPRLEQGVGETGQLEKSNVGNFIKWILSDVQKEGEDELEASGLEWKQIASKISTRAQKWYFKKIENTSG